MKKTATCFHPSAPVEPKRLFQFAANQKSHWSLPWSWKKRKPSIPITYIDVILTQGLLIICPPHTSRKKVDFHQFKPLLQGCLAEPHLKGGKHITNPISPEERRPYEGIPWSKALGSLVGGIGPHQIRQLNTTEPRAATRRCWFWTNSKSEKKRVFFFLGGGDPFLGGGDNS